MYKQRSLPELKKTCQNCAIEQWFFVIDDSETLKWENVDLNPMYFFVSYFIKDRDKNLNLCMIKKNYSKFSFNKNKTINLPRS